MKRIRCKIETFKKGHQEPWEEEPELEPFIVDGGFDAEDVQFYTGIRDDRVAVVFKNGAAVSIVASLVDFETELTRVGI